MNLSPYLHLNGNCAQAFAYYQQHLDGKNPVLIPFRGSPYEQHAPEDWRDKVLHASIEIDGNLLMGSDGMPAGDAGGMSGFSVTINLADQARAERIFAILADNGKITMPLTATFWSSKFGTVTDQFGVPWMINCE